jgi:hypothetical protein
MTTGSEPMVCTLTYKDRRDRVSWIAQLAQDALRTHKRDDLTLYVRYAPEAAERVRKMVHEEQICCAFLKFKLREGSDEVLLTIRAPEAAREVANELFAHFTDGIPPGGQGRDRC